MANSTQGIFRDAIFIAALFLIPSESFSDGIPQCIGNKSVTASSSSRMDDDVRVTTTGAVFKRVVDSANLGESWEDPSGLIWGDALQNANGTIRDLTPEDAAAACAAVGARLPTQQELGQLGLYFGALKSDTLVPLTVPIYDSTTEKILYYYGFCPYLDQVLPNLSYWFWSSSVAAGGLHYYLNGYGGDVAFGYGHSQIAQARCVVRASAH